MCVFSLKYIDKTSSKISFEPTLQGGSVLENGKEHRNAFLQAVNDDVISD